jgi:glycosyltransferase involved in cell wall biosynthesis
MKVLIVAHGHPTLHKGGGEVAAYSLFQSLRARGHHCVFVGWSGQDATGQGSGLTRLDEGDYLLDGRGEFFDFSSRTPGLRAALEALFATHDFDVVHLHHYVHIGIEIAAIAKGIKAAVRTVLTLHEFLAICTNNGQLFTSQGKVCPGYSPRRCVECFPGKSPEDFFMRELTIKAAFGYVDFFLSPSEFLKEQYCRWGLAGERVVVVENPLPLREPIEAPAPQVPPTHAGWKIGFFGQINYYKGLDILLQGIKLANDAGCRVTVGIHGKMAPVGSFPDYLAEVQALIDSLGATAVFHGAYEQSDVFRLMQGYHFVAMGSRWYENSPVVIQEAIAAGRPLIVPGHGGMAEKVTGAGVTFSPGSPLSLRDRLLSLDDKRYQNLLQSVSALRAHRARKVAEDFEAVVAVYSRAAPAPARLN